MRIKLTILGVMIAMGSMANVALPWDSLFASYGLSEKVSSLPMQINERIDLRYNNGYEAGIWGLTTPVARRYGLKIDDRVDERYDLRLSTDVVAKYMSDLVEYYGNEDVAILAYLNGAPLLTDVANLCSINLKSVSNEDMKLLCEHLPKNTICDSVDFDCEISLDSIYNLTGYVKYKFEHPIRKTTLQDSIGIELGLTNAKILPSTRWIDEIFVPESLMLDEVLASVYETEIAAHKEELVATTKADIAQEKARAAAIKKANAVKIYVVKSGDTLGHIAKRHKVTVTQLKKWNGLKSDFLRIGQKLRIEN